MTQIQSPKEHCQKSQTEYDQENISDLYNSSANAVAKRTGKASAQRRPQSNIPTSQHHVCLCSCRSSHQKQPSTARGLGHLTFNMVLRPGHPSFAAPSPPPPAASRAALVPAPAEKGRGFLTQPSGGPASRTRCRVLAMTSRSFQVQTAEPSGCRGSGNGEPSFASDLSQETGQSARHYLSCCSCTLSLNHQVIAVLQKYGQATAHTHTRAQCRYGKNGSTQKRVATNRHTA